MLNNPFDVPRNTLITFLNLGAVRQSAAYHQERDDNGNTVSKPYLYLVYFWDADGQEVGYWNRPCNAGTTNTAGREWHPDTLATHQFYPMTVPDTTEGHP